MSDNYLETSKFIFQEDPQDGSPPKVVEVTGSKFKEMLVEASLKDKRVLLILIDILKETIKCHSPKTILPPS